MTNVIASNDSYIRNSNATYTTARNATAGDNTGATYHYVGAQNGGSVYYMWRSFASFAIPDMATLTAASLFLYGSADASTVDFDVYIHTSTYSNPLVVADFDLFTGHQASGVYNGTILNNAWNSSSYSATWNEIVFNAAGIAAILAAKNTTFRIVLISKNDYDNTAPGVDTNEYVRFKTSSSAGLEPYLALTFTAGGTNFQINIGDSWKVIPAAQINIADTWKPIASAKINIGDSWKTIF